MELVALIEPSVGKYPGHMVIGQESEDLESQFFGYHFNPSSLPADFQSAERWEEYLYSNKVPGNVHDESKYVRDLRADPGRILHTKRVPCAILIDTHMPPRKRWRQ
jgi:hypothetical protein